MVKNGELLHAQVFEAGVEQVNRAAIFRLVVGPHDGVGDLHVGQGVEHGNFLPQDMVIVDHGRPIAPKRMRNRGIVLVGPFLDDLVAIPAVLVLSQTRVLDQAGKLLEFLETLLQGSFAQLAQRKLVGIVANLLEDGVEVVLAGLVSDSI